MSRSAFAEHFAATFGQAPFEFLTEVRLRRAARLLEATDIPIKAVTGTVGYASRSSFSRAFTKLYGVDPTTFRSRGI
jgi:AraC-like DNA-binding protein